MTETNVKRNNEIVNERALGKTYREIGEKYGLSANRIMQICNKAEAIKRYRERATKIMAEQAEHEKYIDENGRLDGLSPRLFNAIRRGGAETKKELVEMLCSENGISVSNVGDKMIAELEEFVGFNIERVMDYRTCKTAHISFKYLHCSILKKKKDDDKNL